MGRRSRQDRSAQQARFPDDDVNKQVERVECTVRDTGLYYCTLENANGQTTVEDSVETVEVDDAPFSVADLEGQPTVLWNDLDHKCEVNRRGRDIITCRNR
jgi:hypothetical protein